MANAYTPATHTRRQPKQNRSKALVDAIYQSCVKIIESGQGERLSVSVIAKTAGITLSSFYQYFPNVQSAVASTILKYDLDPDRYAAIEIQLKQRALTFREVADFLVASACDRHIRFLSRYDRIYRRYHRLVNSQLCVGFHENGLARMIDWEVWFSDFLKRHCDESCPELDDITAFVAITMLIELTGKAVDSHPDLLADDAFRRKVTEILVYALSGEHPSRLNSAIRENLPENVTAQVDPSPQ